MVTPKRRFRKGIEWLLVLLLVGAAASCNNPFDLTELLDGPDGKPLSVLPGSGTVIIAEEVTLVASGGHPPYSYALISGNGSLAGNLYTAPVLESTDRIRVSDGVGNSVEIVFSVRAGSAGLGIDPASAAVLVNGNVDFTPLGGTGPYTFDLSMNNSGATIDPATGVYTAGTTGGVSDVITLTDTSDGSVVGATVAVSPVETNVNYDVSAVTNITGGTKVGEAFAAEAALANTGSADGTQSVSWTVYASADAAIGGPDTLVASGSTAPLLADDLDTGGPDETTIAINGRWPTAPGTYYLIVSIAAADDLTIGDNVAATAGATQIFPPISITPGTDEIYTGESVSFAAAGEGPFAYAVTVNNTGGTVDPSTGSYTAGSVAGTDTITVTDTADGTSASAVISVLPKPLSISPGSILVYTGQTVTFSALGGDGPFTFALTTDGSGAALDPVTGQYTSGNTAGSDAVTVTDAYDGRSRTATILVVDTPPPPNAFDYVVVSITSTNPTPAAGSEIAESFTVRNAGPDDGTSTLNYTVYISPDNSLATTPNYVVDSGSVAALDADDSAPGGTDEATIPINGYWRESAPGPWYIIVRENADYESNPGDELASAEFDLQATLPSVDYFFSAVPAGGSSAIEDTDLSVQFTIDNEGDAGTADIYWSVYASEGSPTYDVSDDLIDNGVYTGGLGPGGSTGSINVNGFWPTPAGSYYLIFRLQSSEDVDATDNTRASLAPYTVTASGIVDYTVTEISSDFPTAQAGTPIAESFTITNLGANPGTQTYDWTLYYNTVDSLDGGEVELASDTGVSALGAGSSLTVGSIGALWPDAGAYYLIVGLVTTDDDNTGNNVVAAGPYTIVDPPDYGFENTNHAPADGTPGAALDTTGLFNFTIRNFAPDPADGSSPVIWRVYASYDSALDGEDTQIASGVLPALAAGTSAPAVDYGSASWPAFGARYYLILTVNADDDETPQNNTLAVGPIEVPQSILETALTNPGNNNDIGPTTVALTNTSDLQAALGSLLPHQLIRIDGTLDGNQNAYDTYRFVIGPGVNGISTYATWSTAADSLDLRVWDELGSNLSSLDVFNDREPDAGDYTITGWVEGEAGYIGVDHLSNVTATYRLYLMGRP